MMKKQKKLFFKENVLFIPTRNIEPIHRHFMHDLMNIIPNSKKHEKIPFENFHTQISTLCEQYRIKTFIIFHSVDNSLILLVGHYPQGPIIKYKVLNINTLKDLQLAGNFSKKGRSILSFDKLFNEQIKYQLVKESLTQLFNIPTPRFNDQFVDRIINFSLEGNSQNRIWIRLYEIFENDLREIGPRFVLEISQITDGITSDQIILYQGMTINSKSTFKKQKIRKSEKKMEKLLNELNTKEEEEQEIDNDLNE